MDLGDSRWFRLDAPGNLLLCGEYAVTEPGGQGLSLAVETRASLICRPQGDPSLPFQFRSLYPGAGSAWTAPAAAAYSAQWLDSPGIPPVLAAIIHELQLVLDQLDLSPSPSIAQACQGMAMSVDTGAFFDPRGQKMGLGSSAAACLLATAGLCQLLSSRLPLPERERLWQVLPQLAVDSHRRLQGGKGSGYDILCSLHGGLGWFTGGAQPAFRGLDPALLRDLASFCLLTGPAAVRSAPSIDTFRAWAQAKPRRAIKYRQGCAQRVQALLSGRQNLAKTIAQARQAGIKLGRELGIPATFTLPKPARKIALAAKALGAGNETILVAGDSRELPRVLPDHVILHPAESGLRGGRIVGEASAHGKLLLWGEHTALWGWPAVGLPLPSQCTIRLIEDPNPKAGETKAFNVNGQNLDPEETMQFMQICRLATEWLGIASFPENSWLDIVSTVPRCGGYGSSAAFSAALARLVLQLAPRAAKAKSEWHLANYIDGSFHGRASGIDSGLALANGPLVFTPRPTADTQSPGQPLLDSHPLNLAPKSPPICLVHAGIGRRADTKTLVGGISERLGQSDPDTRRLIDQLGAAAAAAIAALEAGAGAPELGALADQAHGILGELGVGNQTINRLIETGKGAGACGGKISGAGGGGAFFLVCADTSSADKVWQALLAAGCRAEVINLPMQETL